jgi:hypothetical protein
MLKSPYMSSERKNIGRRVEVDPPLAQMKFRVPGIGPGDFEDGEVKDEIKRKKLENALVDAADRKSGTPSVNWHHVIDNIDSGKHTGFFVVTSGAIIVTIGIELARHGEDIRKLLGLVRKYYKKEKK